MFVLQQDLKAAERAKQYLFSLNENANMHELQQGQYDFFEQTNILSVQMEKWDLFLFLSYFKISS